MSDEDMTRIDREAYPVTLQALLQMEYDAGAPSCVVGPLSDGIADVPTRWLPYLPRVEAHLASLSQEKPWPGDVDVIAWIEKNPEDSDKLLNSEYYCFIAGEHTPMLEMQRVSLEAHVAGRFLNDFFDAWSYFDGSAPEYPPADSPGWSPEIGYPPEEKKS